jgi:hypothetical protein
MSKRVKQSKRSKSICAPGKEYPCYTIDQLRQMAREYNKDFPTKKIRVNQSRTALVNEFKYKLKGTCGKDESCWINQRFARRIRNTNLHNQTFKPTKPNSWTDNPNEWLSTSNIDNVMKQYEHAYADFVYPGTVPVDCPSGILCALSSVDLRKLQKGGKRKLGTIFNLDYHYEGGSHWVALYIDINNGSIEYHDSYAKSPPRLISQFMNKMADQIEDIGIEPILIVNDKRHQYGGSECGVYSMYYIISRLMGKLPSTICRRRIKDEEMTGMREIYYK